MTTTLNDNSQRQLSPTINDRTTTDNPIDVSSVSHGIRTRSLDRSSQLSLLLFYCRASTTIVDKLHGRAHSRIGAILVLRLDDLEHLQSSLPKGGSNSSRRIEGPGHTVSTMSTTEPIVPIDEPIEPVEPVIVRAWQTVRVIQTVKTLESLYAMHNQRAAPHLARSVPRSLAALTKANTASTMSNTIAQTVLQVPHVSTAGPVAVHSFGSFRLKADPQNVWHNVWRAWTAHGLVALNYLTRGLLRIMLVTMGGLWRRCYSLLVTTPSPVDCLARTTAVQLHGRVINDGRTALYDVWLTWFTREQQN